MISKEIKLREFEEFLYIGMKEIVEETEDQPLAAFRVAIMIACHSNEVDSIRLDFYLSKLKISQALLDSAIRYFIGAGFLKIVGEHPFNKPEALEYLAGQKAKSEKDEMWRVANKAITHFREAFWSDTW